MAHTLPCGICLCLLVCGDAASGAPPALPQDPCEPLVAVRWLQRESEAPAADAWRIGASADRLRGDECGHVWGLWFNSWVLHAGGEAKRIGHLQIPSDGAFASLAGAGVADFQAEAGALFVLGRNGEFARRDRRGWQALPAPQACTDGRLARAGDTLWLSCTAAPGQHLLARWLRGPQRWRIERRAHGLRPLLLAATPGRVYALGPGGSALIEGDRIGARVAGDLPLAPLQGAIDSRRLALAGERGLWVQDRDSGSWQEHLSGEAITAVAFDAQGTLWAAVRDDGVRALVEGAWLSWRYAQGLPDAEARDLLVDAEGRLWLAGTPSAVIDARAAARRMRALAPPAAIPVLEYADACRAVAAQLGGGQRSGEVARARIDGIDLAFFGTRQACPDPWRAGVADRLIVRRAADGALLELASNGLRGHFDCGLPCVEPARDRLARSWRVVVHLPSEQGWQSRELPPPQPQPRTSPGPVAWLSGSGTVWVADGEGQLYRNPGDGWLREPAGTGPDNRAMAIAQGRDGEVWIGSSPSWSREQRRYAGTPLHRWRGGRWRDLAVGAAGHAWAVWAILPLADGALVAGNGGVRRLRADGSEVLGSDPLSQLWVDVLAMDGDGVWWALHGGGDPGLSIHVDGRWRRLSSREGLLADAWRVIAFDATDRAWLLAEDGRVAIYTRAELLARALP